MARKSAPLLLLAAAAVLLAGAPGSAWALPTGGSRKMLGAAAATPSPAAAASRCPFAGLLSAVGTTGVPVDAVKAAFAKGSKAAPLTPPQFSAPSSCTPDQYRAYASAVADAIRSGDNATLQAPKAARLAFHAAFTYSPTSTLGGPNGAWIDFPQEVSWAANAGLAEPLATVKALKSEHPCLTLADAIAFAGVVGVEAGGGPALAFIPGRRDALSAPATGAAPLAAKMPDGSFGPAAVGLSFISSGFSARDAVALMGGHSFGGADETGSGWSGAFTPAGDAWPEPKNRYFVDLVDLEWEPMTVEATGRVQYVPKPGQAKAAYTTSDGENALVMRLPSDMALLQHPVFAELAKLYARDEATFLSDFARAYQRMLQMGAGEGAWQLMPDKFVWLGLNGTAVNYGASIAPM